MNTVKNHKRSIVYYNSVKDTFVKLFFPKVSKKIKYFFQLRKYPGHNFKYINDELNKIGILTAKIVSYDKYSVTTKNLHGPTLDKFIKDDLNHPLVKEFIKIAVKILKSGFYNGDFAFKNFIVKDNKIYAIDLEDYRKERFFTHDINYAIKRLGNQLPKPVAQKIKEELICLK